MAVTAPLPEEEGLGEKVEPSLAKEGRGGTKKTALQGGYIPWPLRGKGLGESGGALLG